MWGLRGNVLDVPTDCPQRDERLGWTGDLAAFAPTAAFLYDVEGFLRDWLADLAAEQRAADGRVPFVAPDVLKYIPQPPGRQTPESTAIWGDAAVWVPWALWEAYGNVDVLEQAYDAMTAHVRRVESLLSPTGLWDTGFQFADWLDPTAPPDDPAAAKADKGVVATACLYRSARLTAGTARILGRAADAEHFGALAERTRAAFARALRVRRREGAQRRPDRVRPRDRLRPARRTGSGSGPGTGSPNSSPRAGTASPPGSPAPRSSPTP